MVDITDNLQHGNPSHEDIGVARLRMQSRHLQLGAYNARYRQDKSGVQVNVGVAVTLTEAERVKLLERWEKAQAALADRQENG